MPAKILVVDPDKDTRELYRVVMQARGFRVIEADGPDTGRAAVGSCAPAGIITELRFQDGYGGPFVREVRAALPDCAIIVVTSLAMDTVNQTQKNEGWDRYFVKPVSIDELATAMLWLVKKS